MLPTLRESVTEKELYVICISPGIRWMLSHWAFLLIDLKGNNMQSQQDTQCYKNFSDKEIKPLAYVFLSASSLY